MEYHKKTDNLINNIKNEKLKEKIENISTFISEFTDKKKLKIFMILLKRVKQLEIMNQKIRYYTDTSFLKLLKNLIKN